jgi:hypothetical protein
MARLILALLDTAMIRADDVSMQNAAAAKQWLRAISSGNLIVQPPAEVAKAA